MNLTNTVTLDVKKDERVYLFSCPGNAPLGECFDALQEFTAYMIQRMKEVQPQPEVKEVECTPES